MAEFKNPNQQSTGGPGSTGGNSLMMYFSLFLLVFLGLQYFRGKSTPAPAHPQSTSSAVAAPTQAVPTPIAATATQSDGTPAIQATAATTTVVENALYRITLSNRGGEATSWILKNYKDMETGKPLDLVNRQASARYGYPLSLYTYEPALNTQLSQSLFVPSNASATLATPGTLTYTYAANGMQVKKTFSFDNTYVVHATVSVTRNGAPVAAALAWPSGFGDQQTLPQYASASFDASLNGKAAQTDIKKISGGNTLRGNYDWGGVSDLYFAAIFLPDHPANASLITLHNSVSVAKNVKKPNDGETSPAPVLGAALVDASGTLDTRLFVGPKTLGALSAVHGVDGGPSLDKIVSFGWWSILSTPLFLLLRWLHDHVIGNWGWSILILTVLLSLLTLPTRIAMMRSSMKMQRIQPQMDAIKKRYAQYKATDPKRQEMNQEIFKVQKDNGVNMFGSCLPMLIQWPLLFAFYRMLSNVIELRQAHWLWVPDLSSPDPIHLLPIFFVGSMFLVQWLTPSPGVDPQQQRMMAITMPAVFGFMTWSIGAGLALYWAASNLLGILIQLGMNKTAMGREMRELALRRAAKKNGKTINAKIVSPRKA
ncbi:membrane protein insertase YidC [Acidipila sp. EB88]|uniref:membrane protein insertase YidC n=1 Tax=Acidipila sp. EB88 TaxID=2305226 RepID=UPI000F5E71F0|nr:membrane protein insertase YidC [Acidipila sp. EB88]RRA48355.1 membrane protein insertase YidC [Acidipila sp. EB88]